MRGILMGKQTIGNILELNKHLKLKDLPVITKALKLYGVLTPLRNNESVDHVLNQLRQNDPEVLGKTIKELLNPRSTTDEWCSNAKSIIMWLMLMIMSGAYTASNIYISMTTMTAIPWEDMFLPLIGPILLVLHERGVVSRENRDTLSAISGVHPAMTLLESISQRIANGPPVVAKRKNRTEVDEAPKVKDEDY